MYNVIIVLQVIAVLVALFSVGCMIHFRLGMDSRYLLVASLCTTMYATGYLFEMLSNNMETAFTSLAFQYLGASYIGTLFLMFICEFCNLHLRRRIWFILAAFDFAVMVLAMTARYHDLFFASAQWNETGLYAHLDYEFGPGFIAFLGKQGFMVILALCITVKQKKSFFKKSDRARLVLMTVTVSAFSLGVCLSVFMPLGAYDSASFLTAVTALAFTFFVTHFKMINVANRAYTSLYRDLDEGVIIADGEKHYLEANAMAKTIFPQLKTWDTGTSLDNLEVDLCEFGNRDSFEINGKSYTSLAKPILEQRRHIGYIIILKDVTEISVRLEELRKMKESADSINAAQSAFIANMSHEIRTPLNAIIGMAELAERETVPEGVKEYVSQIKNAGKMLLDVVCETVDFSKAETGKLELIPSEFDLLTLINSVVNVINVRIAEKPVEFIVDADPTLPRSLFADDIRLRQIMINFLGNAEQYTQNGHIRFTIGYEQIGPKKIMLNCSVEDTGSGISTEDAEKLFRPFAAAESGSACGKVVGTGLGLAISAELLDIMDGTYDFSSTYGKGSTFSFKVPLDVIDASPIAEGAVRTALQVPKNHAFTLYGLQTVMADKIKTGKGELKRYPGAKVLVVDDNKVNVKVLCAFLDQFEIEPDFCYCGPDAIIKAETEDYDLILMDHMMPDMDGVEATKQIRNSAKESNRTVPIIACSANVMKGAEGFFLENGMNDYVSKPVQLATLAEKLSRFLAEKQE